MSVLYSTKAHAVGGRHGTVRSDDGVLELDLAIPKVMGGKGGATNPEQLFAAGYAACFENAVIHVSRNKATKVRESDIEVDATVGIGPSANGGFALTVALDVTVAGVDLATAESIVREAHETCPYSNAVKGNIDVQISTRVR